MPPEDQAMAIALNYSRLIVRVPVGQFNRGFKQSSVSGGIARVSLHEHQTKAELLIEWTVYLHAVIMSKRGQCHMSNPAVLSHKLDGVDVVAKFKFLNETLRPDNLFTEPNKKARYFGSNLTNTTAHDLNVVLH